MKRIIDGLTYNTDTSTAFATYEYENDKGYDVDATIYQSLGGALFVVHRWETKDKTYKYHFEAITRGEINMMIERGTQIEITDESVLETPPEAAVEAEAGATIYVRVPASLKRRVDEASRDEKISGNQWAMRCMEKCLDEREIRDFPGFAFIDATAESGIEGNWPISTYIEALKEIRKWNRQICKKLIGLDNPQEDMLLIFDGHTDLRDAMDRFNPYPSER